MKHPIFDRFLMLLFALAALCVAAFFALVAAGTITPAMIIALISRYDFNALIVRAALVGGAVVAAFFGLLLLSAIFPAAKKRSSTFAIQKNENGVVRISLKALDALVQKCLKEHEELTVVSSSLFSDEESIRVDAHINLAQDVSMPLAVSSLQRQIKRYIEACSGVMVQEVRVYVDGVNEDSKASEKSPYAIPSEMLAPEAAAESAAEEVSPFAEPVVTPAEAPSEPASEPCCEAPAAEIAPEVIEADAEEIADETAADEE